MLLVLGEQPLQVARCTKIINADSDEPKYIINVKQFAKFVVDLSDQVAPTDIEEGMRVGYVEQQTMVLMCGLAAVANNWSHVGCYFKQRLTFIQNDKDLIVYVCHTPWIAFLTKAADATLISHAGLVRAEPHLCDEP